MRELRQGDYECMAAFDDPFYVNGYELSMLTGRAYTEHQFVNAIPYHHLVRDRTVAYQQRQYQLPGDARLLSQALLAAYGAGSLACECF